MRSYTILYVDDDHDDLLLVSEAFEKHTDDLRVIHAYNGLEALRILGKMKLDNSLPCLIILDINMPVMDGKETLKAIKDAEHFKEIPAVLFSTSTSGPDKKFAEDLGADFITKPIKYAHLENLVEQFVEKCRFEVGNTK